MSHRKIFEDLASESKDRDDFVRKGCDRGLFVSMAEGRRIWSGFGLKTLSQNGEKTDRKEVVDEL